jgi:hypothetical protein
MKARLFSIEAAASHLRLPSQVSPVRIQAQSPSPPVAYRMHTSVEALKSRTNPERQDPPRCATRNGEGDRSRDRKSVV